MSITPKRINLICLGVLHILLFTLFFFNFPRGEFFIGWDSVTPEFDIWLNLRRAFFAFWQENYGLGLLGGHGFAATLPHTLIISVLKAVLPLEAIRTIFTYICLYVGTLGMYQLCLYITGRLDPQHHWERIHAPAALLAALYYALNLGTLQMFYIQLEAFIFHYAALPWLFYSLLLYLEKPSSKRLILLIVVNFLASGQGFIPPLFVAYSFAVTIFAIIYLFNKNQNFSNYLKRFIVVAVVFVATNLYWLLPLGYYTITRSDVYLNSYNNLQTTPDFISLNKKYGDIQNVPLIKGFIFEGSQLTKNNVLEPVFKPWLAHQAHPFIPFIGYIFFVLSIVGIVGTLLYFKNPIIRGFLGVFLFFFTGLTTNFIPFSAFTHFLQNYMPIYRQAFRAAFTKFSIGVAFGYSLFIAIGVVVLFIVMQRYPKTRPHTKLLSVIFLIGIIIYGYPAFQGEYLYKEAKLTIPKAYSEMNSYLKDKPPLRIAEFPQDCAEGWFHYNWGYIGSGFLWYSTEQPFMSRTFDVWSNYNENYYWEVLQAVREQNFVQLDAVFEKYDISYVMYDPNKLHCRNTRAFLYNEVLADLPDYLPNYELEKQFNTGLSYPILLLKRTNSPQNSFVQLSEKPLNVAPSYTWNEKDTALKFSSSYITDLSKPTDIYLPFRSLFSKRKENELESEIQVNTNSVQFKSNLPSLGSTHLYLPAYSEQEKIVPAQISSRKTRTGDYDVFLKYSLPSILAGEKVIFNGNKDVLLGTIKAEIASNSAQVSVNAQEYEFTPGNTVIKTGLLTQNNNDVTVQASSTSLPIVWNSQQDPTFSRFLNSIKHIPLSLSSETPLTVVFPKVLDPNQQFGAEFLGKFAEKAPVVCNSANTDRKIEYQVGVDKEPYIRLAEQNNSTCVIYNMPHLETSLSYLIDLKTRYITGDPAKIYVSNGKRVQYLELNAPTERKMTNLYSVIPATFADGVGYDIYYNVFSKNTDISMNDFGGLGVYVIPYNYMKNIVISRNESLFPLERNDLSSVELNVEHPFETAYVIRVGDSIGLTTPLLSLSQGYDPAWQLYRFERKPRFLDLLFPYLTGGERIPGPIKVNNWKNGWYLPSNVDSRDVFVISYVPQAAQLFGYGVLGLVGLFTIGLLIRSLLRKRTT